MAFRVEIVEFEGTPNTVEIYDGEAAAPFIRQPNWPNQAPWADREEAEAWAGLFIASIVDPAAPYAPNGPGLAGEPKPTPEEIAEWEARQLAMNQPPVPPTA